MVIQDDSSCLTAAISQICIHSVAVVVAVAVGFCFLTYISPHINWCCFYITNGHILDDRVFPFSALNRVIFTCNLAYLWEGLSTTYTICPSIDLCKPFKNNMNALISHLTRITSVRSTNPPSLPLPLPLPPPQHSPPNSPSTRHNHSSLLKPTQTPDNVHIIHHWQVTSHHLFSSPNHLIIADSTTTATNNTSCYCHGTIYKIKSCKFTHLGIIP